HRWHEHGRSQSLEALAIGSWADHRKSPGRGPHRRQARGPSSFSGPSSSMFQLRQLLDRTNQQLRGLQVPVKETRHFVGAGRNLSTLDRSHIEQSLQIELQLFGDVRDYRLGVRRGGTSEETLYPAQ